MKIVCFDLGWTLEDETNAQHNRLVKTAKELEKYNYNISVETMIEKQIELGDVGCTSVYNDLLTSLGISDQVITFVKDNVKWDPNLCKKYEGINELLKELKEKGNKIVLIANQSKSVNNRLKQYGIFDYFDRIICSCDVGYEKPNLEIFKMVYLKYPKNNEFWMIGDRVDNDILPARNLGWKTIRILKGSHKNYREKNSLEIADYKIKEINELRDIKEIFI